MLILIIYNSMTDVGDDMKVFSLLFNFKRRLYTSTTSFENVESYYGLSLKP